jgi:hypothetical protein
MNVAVALLLVTCAASQSRLDALVATLRPVLPFPAAAADGALPADNSAQAKWFVVWPADPSDPLVVVKANPLNPEVQKAAAEAMGRINAAVAIAERKAQAAYDKALEELRRTGGGSDIESITLDDEGVAGERIDAELELSIELQPAASFAVASSVAPVVAAGAKGPTWVVNIPANTYRSGSGADAREHFRAAEARLYFGALAKPSVARKGDEPLFNVTVATATNAYAVVLRGNEALLKQVVTTADWSKLSGD